MKLYIIVTGIPASGKSTLGRAVAAALGIPMLDKDDMLEALFESRGVGDAAWRRDLSRVADETLRDRALELKAAVISSWWRHPESQVDSGTPTQWLEALPSIKVELHCVCSPPVAAARFLSRKRHAGHLDRFKTQAEVVASFAQQAAFGPLGLGRLVQVDTERDIDLSTVLFQIKSASN
jgi:glucokinase